MRILNAALELFKFEGMNATGVGRIASKVSVSKQTRYQRFPSNKPLGLTCGHDTHRLGGGQMTGGSVVGLEGGLPSAVISGLSRMVLGDELVEVPGDLLERLGRPRGAGKHDRPFERGDDSR